MQAEPIELKRYEFDISQKSVADALNEFSEQTGAVLLFPYELVEGRTANELVGEYGLTEALDMLLDGSGLSGGLVQSEVIRISLRTENTETIREETAVNNKVKRSLLASAAAILFGTGTSNVALAQDAPATGEDAESVQDVVIVTATRREQNLQDVPMAVSVVDPLEFASQGVSTLSDVLDYTPGFSFNQLEGVRGSGSITARGVSQQGGASVVGVYVDDVAITSGTPLSHSNLMAFDGLLGDVERVELLNGPQGTLYGAASVGGAVKYVTRKPSLEGLEGRASVNLSTAKDGGLKQAYSGRVSFPLIEDRIGLSVSGFFEDDEGFVDRVDSATGNVLEEDFGNSEAHGYVGDLFVSLTPDFDFRGKVISQTTKFSGDYRVNYDAATASPSFGRNRTALGPQDGELVFDVYSGTFEYRFDWATLTSVTAFSNRDRLIDSDLFTPSFGAIMDGVIGQPSGTTTSVPFLNTSGSERWTQEVRLTSEASEKLEWQIGLFYADEEGDIDQLGVALPTNDLLLRSDNDAAYEEYAVFGNVTYYVTPNFDVTLGARISDTTLTFDREAEGAFAGGVIPLDPVSDTADTWLFAARYRPSDSVSLYARAASGFRPASTNIPVVDANGNNLAPDVVDADTVWSYEIGAKGRALDGLLTYDVAAYYLDWKDFQAVFTVNARGALTNSDNGIEVKGVEGTVSLHPIDGLSIISNFAYTDSVLKGDEPDLIAVKGRAVPDVPEWTASIRARQEFQLTRDWGGHLAGGLRYRAETPPEFRAPEGVPGDEYVVADLSAGLTNGRVALSLYANNLFDEVALLRFENSQRLATPLRPRTIGFELSTSF